MAGLGWPTLAMPVHGWPWLAMVGLRWPWLTMAGHGWLWLAILFFTPSFIFPLDTVQIMFSLDIHMMDTAHPS